MLVGCELHFRSWIGWGENLRSSNSHMYTFSLPRKCNKFTNFQWTCRHIRHSHDIFSLCNVQEECRKDLDECGYIWLNLIRFAFIDCACTLLLSSRKSATWYVTVLQLGVRLQRIAVFLHKRPNAVTIITISSKLLFILICGKSFVHWQVHQ